ncbi:MAG: 1-acyl-sn-glycerol-3-phosphate acyltransferase, partial [Patescibacteria group bacterium]
ENAEATKKVFTSEGFFRTGDNGYLDEFGNLHIKGRQKEMIVTGAGINVYPDDIEPFLIKQKEVREVCVIGKQTKDGEEVHAVFVFDDGKIQDGTDRHQIAKSILEKVNNELDSLQQIGGYTIWHEKEFPKTSTMKIQKFKVKQCIEERTGESVNGLASEITEDKLISIISKVTGKNKNEVSENSVLVSDLGLTSIVRLELVNMIEQEYRLDMEDSAINQNTTVCDLRNMIEKREKHKNKNHLHSMTDNTLVRLTRGTIDKLIFIPIFRYFVNMKVTGLENIINTEKPVLLVSNHLSYFDIPAIFYALPSKIRYEISVAAGDEFFFQENGSALNKFLRNFAYRFASFFFNIFILPQKEGFRSAIQFMGNLIDNKKNIAFFPEGGLMRDGKILPFQKGIGLLVRELRIPVIPV